MKKDLLIDETAHGKRLLMIDPSESKQLVEEGEAVHVRGNVYQTKVMRADMRESCAGQKLEEAEPLPPPPMNHARKESEPQQRKRGRPRKGA